jgi:acyl-CoA thioesterase
MRIARLTLDLMRPAPIAPAAVAVEIVREGRNIQLLSLVMEIAGKIVARASVLRVREGDTQPAAQAPALDAPPPEDCAQLTQFGASGFGENFDLRLARGPWRSGRPTAVWFRLKAQLIDGVETSPAMRAAAIADFGNGISSVLDFNAWTFINADLTLNFARAPEGDWMLLDAETWIGPDGGGFAASRLCDRAGAFARGHQNLVIARR